ncbi:gamma-glutamyltransferase family protein [Atopococcus tabaci]|uniref:gamma-glutamyltransferase family protein n=1 Tax=Atopococcus tabaci TaxID=269774 RepID=UPI0004187ADD|nr:gamma-glutamyltransferase family protein [Atopococcus tabaci]
MKFLTNPSNPYTISRKPLYAKNGMVATSQPLAAQAGLSILQKGGNAIDAAIATAACLTVVEPTTNGIGGDAFALVWTKGELHGLNGSGKSPQSISIDALKEKGHETMPTYGWIPVTVPGAPGAWAELSDRFGVLPFEELLEPAISYAEEGFPVSPTIAKFWKKAFVKYEAAKEKLPELSEWFTVFAPDGRAPKVGEIWSSPRHAATLREIAETTSASFYHGALAQKMVRASKEAGGFLSHEDLAAYRPEWVDPIHARYHGYDVWEIPPNGQGIVALEALGLLDEYTFSSKGNVELYHKQIEAIKLAFSDAKQYVTEEIHMPFPSANLLDPAYLDKRRELISEYAQIPEAGEPFGSGTVYLATADKDGNMVSLIQSNYMGFGSGVVVPGTGIAMQNRGHDFSLDETHVNALAGGKKTFHTIIPGFLTKDGQPVGPFGVMGGAMQPQAHVQVVSNTVDFHLNPQAALDAPRWQWLKDKTVSVENTFPHYLAEELAEKGHEIQIEVENNSFGRGQIIWRDPETGVLVGGTESRTDGSIVGW